MTICGVGKDWPDAGEGICCVGAAMRGPQGCTCWVPVYDLEQAEPIPARPVPRPAPCADCAYRPDSPEQRGESHVNGDADELERILRGDIPFHCHDGIRRPLRHEHRSDEGPWTGAVVEGSAADYCPPIIDGVPYRADGSPAFVCAGWAARKAALT